MMDRNIITAAPGHRLHWFQADKKPELHTSPIVGWEVIDGGCKPITVCSPRRFVIAAGVEVPTGEVYAYRANVTDSVLWHAKPFASLDEFKADALMAVEMNNRFMYNTKAA